MNHQKMKQTATRVEEVQRQSSLSEQQMVTRLLGQRGDALPLKPAATAKRKSQNRLSSASRAQPRPIRSLTTQPRQAEQANHSKVSQLG